VLAAYLTAHPRRLYASVNTKYCTQLSPYRVRPLHGELEEPNNLNTPVAMATVAIPKIKLGNISTTVNVKSLKRPWFGEVVEKDSMRVMFSIFRSPTPQHHSHDGKSPVSCTETTPECLDNLPKRRQTRGRDIASGRSPAPSTQNHAFDISPPRFPPLAALDQRPRAPPGKLSTRR
jgi:hypothetical protein